MMFDTSTMTELLKEIKKTIEEISNLKSQLVQKEGYLSGLEKASKIQGRSESKSSESLRPGTMLYDTMMLIKNNSTPMHITDILKGLGRENTQSNRVSLVGSLGAYYRKKQIFTRPKPNTFGLIGMDNISKEKDMEDFFGDPSSEEFDESEVEF